MKAKPTLEEIKGMNLDDQQMWVIDKYRHLLLRPGPEAYEPEKSDLYPYPVDIMLPQSVIDDLRKLESGARRNAISTGDDPMAASKLHSGFLAAVLTDWLVLGMCYYAALKYKETDNAASTS